MRRVHFLIGLIGTITGNFILTDSTSSTTFSEAFGSAAACELYVQGGVEAVVASPNKEADFFLVTPHELAGSGWKCTAPPGEHQLLASFKCRRNEKSFHLQASISSTGAGTLSLTIGQKRVVLGSCALRSSSAKFLQYPIGGKVALVYSGQIQNGDYDDFLVSLDKIKPDMVVLDSPGGDVREAMWIGMEIQKRGLNTSLRSNQICTSACALVFFAGRMKFLSRGASIGLHSAANTDGAASLEGTALMEGYLLALGVPAELLQRMYSYGPSEMLWLSDKDRATLRVVNLWP